MGAIICTRPDRGVSIIHPTPEVMSFLTNGGMPDGYLGRTIQFDWEVYKFVRDPNWHPHLTLAKRERIAARWIFCVMFGGLTEAEAHGLVRDKDIEDDWTAAEIVDDSELPSDRWFRNAWTRSPNGGPISVDLDRARPLQRRHILTAIDEAKKPLRDDVAFGDHAALFRLSRLDAIDLPALGRAVRTAETEQALRAVWPVELKPS